MKKSRVRELLNELDLSGLLGLPSFLSRRDLLAGAGRVAITNFALSSQVLAVSTTCPVVAITETMLPERFVLLGKLERQGPENYFVMGDTDSPESVYCNAEGDFFNPPRGKLTAICTDGAQAIPESKAGKIAFLSSHTPSLPSYVFPILEKFVERVPFQVR